MFVVDDDAGIRRALTRLLQSTGRHVEAFASAHALLDRLPASETGCVILDVQMPGTTGPELHAQLSRAGCTLPVIFLTAHGDVPTSVRAMKNGAVDFLQKPVDDALLLQAVDAAIARHAQARERHERKQAVLGRFARLSPREREVMAQVVRGRLNKQIGIDLGIALRTVKVHRGQVMAKMEVDSVAELVLAWEFADLAAPGEAPPPSTTTKVQLAGD